jgi:hypothetical protein
MARAVEREFNKIMMRYEKYILYIENCKNMGAIHTNFMGRGQAMLLMHISYAIPCH